MDPPNSSAPADTLPADNPLQPDTEQHSAAATAANVSTLNNGDTTAGTSDETEFTSDNDILSSAGLFNVETTPAFKILEFMKTRRDVSQDEVAELKVRLQSLHSVLLDSFEAEKSSLKKLNNLNGMGCPGLPYRCTT